MEVVVKIDIPTIHAEIGLALAQRNALQAPKPEM